MSWNIRFRDSSRYADFGMLSRKYAGQFWINIPDLIGSSVLVMVGADGQQIAMDMNKSRIVVINAGQEGYYNTRKLGMEPLKYGRIQQVRTCKLEFWIKVSSEWKQLLDRFWVNHWSILKSKD